ncbi:MAG: hypothetical protein JXR05_06475 [Flavobacteriaceae bacterium]
MIKKKLSLLLGLCLLVALFTYSTSSSQNKKIDSLNNEFYKADIDSIKSRVLLEISIAYYRIDFEKSKFITDSLIGFAKNRSPKYYGLAYRMRGTLNLLDGNYSLSEEDYLKALDIFKNINASKFIVLIYENLGSLDGRREKLNESNNYYLKAIKLSDSIGNKKFKFNSYLNLGINYFKLHLYEDSNDYYIKALEIAEENNDKQNIVHVLFTLGNNYLSLKQYSLGEVRLTKALHVAEEIESNFSLAKINNSLGYLYEHRDRDFYKALNFYKNSVYYNEKVNNKSSLKTSYYNVALQYIYLKKYKQAEIYINKGLTISDNLNSYDGKVKGKLHSALLSIKKGEIPKSQKALNQVDDLLRNRSKLSYKNNFFDIAAAYEEKGDFMRAYSYHKLYTQLTDSVNQRNDIEKIADVEAKYENQKKENKILQLEKNEIASELKIEKQQKRNWLLLLSLFILCFVAYFIWRRFIVERKTRELISDQKRNIEKQNKMIIDFQNTFNHDIFNNLRKINLFVNLSRSKIKTKESEKILDVLDTRISSINEIHSQLLGRWGDASISFSKLVDNLLSRIASLSDNKKVKIQIKIDEALNISYEKSRCLSHIINEFVTNSFKHAFNEGGEGNIIITMEELDSKYVLTLSDNGKGLDEEIDFNKPQSFGLKSTYAMIQQLGGTCSFKNQNGLILTIYFSDNEPPK